MASNTAPKVISDSINERKGLPVGKKALPIVAAQQPNTLKSYVFMKLPLESRITDQIADLRFNGVTEPNLTVEHKRVETSCEISHRQLSLSAYRRVSGLATPWPKSLRQTGVDRRP